MKQERERAASEAYRASSSAELIVKRMHHEAYQVYEWITDANDGRLPDRKR